MFKIIFINLFYTQMKHKSRVPLLLAFERKPLREVGEDHDKNIGETQIVV